MKFYYGLLFVLLLGSFYVFINFTLTGEERNWQIYANLYFRLMLVYTWYVYILLFLDDLKVVSYPSYHHELISVIVPCYNEQPELLKKSLESVLSATGNVKVLVIDDGSKEEIRKEVIRIVSELKGQEERISLKIFEENKGKRHALHHAITNLISDSEFVVTIDSDTILDKNALVRIVEPLKNSAIGASTGDVRLLNEKQNWLTKMIATYYWIGLNIYKKAQSSRGMVVCCSGCLAAYKTTIIKEIIEEFVNQEFFGERCAHSEDRHLTNLILKRNYQVVYVPEAISYTETPATIRGFLKQQQRWKRGYIRESLYTLTYAWKIRPLLFLQVLLWDLTAPFLTFGLRLAVLVIIFSKPGFFFFFILPSWITFMLVRYIFVLFYAKEKIWGIFTYALFYEVFLYWMNIYALFTVKNKSWITR